MGEEVARICPSGGRVLGAGACLRLGGAHLGGYGEQDIAYAYRQLSRALHPDKNPDIRDLADAAFKRLTEAADELRQGLTDQRQVLQSVVGAIHGQIRPEMLERPQEALFAEATRILTAVLGICGEGYVPTAVQSRALFVFTTSSAYNQLLPDTLLSSWFGREDLISLFSGVHLRTAYDCAPKRLRAQFLCALNRCATAEAKRNLDNVRGCWGGIFQQFPELQFWREFVEHIKQRCTAPPKVKPKRSMWDQPKADEKEESSDDELSASPSPSPEPVEEAPRLPPEPEVFVPEIKQQEVRDGDWYCFRCKDLQFKRNSVCRKCKTPRPPEATIIPPDVTSDEQAHGGICVEFKYNGTCRNGAACKYKHDQSDKKSTDDKKGEKQGEDDGAARKRRRKEREKEKRKNKRREKTFSDWARKWRDVIRLVLPSSVDHGNHAVPVTDPEVRKLVAAIWKDLVAWASETEGVPTTCFNFFRSEGEGSARGFPQRAPCEWVFAPAEDLLLTIGEELVGLTVEGLFVDTRVHPRLTLEDAYVEADRKRAEKEMQKKMREIAENERLTRELTAKLEAEKDLIIAAEKAQQREGDKDSDSDSKDMITCD